MSGVKTFSNETSERYALALFELASENSEVEIIEKNIILLKEVCDKNPEFIYFIKNPTHQLNIHYEVFSQIVKIMKFNKTLENFLYLIIKKRRIYFLDKIIDKFIKLSSQKKGKIDAILVSSKELSNEQKEKISLDISKVIKSKIKFNFKTDKKLISGIKIQVGSLLIDTSVSNKLKRIKQSMIEI